MRNRHTFRSKTTSRESERKSEEEKLIKSFFFFVTCTGDNADTRLKPPAYGVGKYMYNFFYSKKTSFYNPHGLCLVETNIINTSDVIEVTNVV